MNLELVDFVQVTGVPVLDVLLVQSAAIVLAMAAAAWATRGDKWRQYGGDDAR
jgi:hypothetical protein